MLHRFFVGCLRDRDIRPPDLLVAKSRWGAGHAGGRIFRRVILLNPGAERNETRRLDELRRRQSDKLDNNSISTYLGHRVRCHEPENVVLDAVVQLDQILEL